MGSLTSNLGLTVAAGCDLGTVRRPDEAFQPECLARISSAWYRANRGFQHAYSLFKIDGPLLCAYAFCLNGWGGGVSGVKKCRLDSLCHERVAHQTESLNKFPSFACPSLLSATTAFPPKCCAAYGPPPDPSSCRIFLPAVVNA